MPLVSGAELLAKTDKGSQDKDEHNLDQARAALVSIVRLAPHNSRAWLQIAIVEMGLGAARDATAAALKMSYYTGPNEADLVPLRIGLAANPDFVGDTELRMLLETEILTIARQPSTLPLLVQAYRQASPDGQRRLLDLITAIDAGLAASVKAGAAKP
jgi:hypothetical protein